MTDPHGLLSESHDIAAKVARVPHTERSWRADWRVHESAGGGRRIGESMRSRLIVASALAVAIVSPAFAADCLRDSYGTVVCGRGQCLMDEYGKVYCAKEGGGTMREQYGKVVCGIGYCAADNSGRVKCSTRPGGGALMDINGKVQCAGGCQDASAQFCEMPTASPATATR
jgi:hypothetical protein